MEIDYAVYSLSDEFYEKYPNPPYKELLKKKERSMLVYLFKVIMDILYAFHKYAYHFR